MIRFLLATADFFVLANKKIHLYDRSRILLSPPYNCWWLKIRRQNMFTIIKLDPLPLYIPPICNYQNRHISNLGKNFCKQLDLPKTNGQHGMDLHMQTHATPTPMECFADSGLGRSPIFGFLLVDIMFFYHNIIHDNLVACGNSHCILHFLLPSSFGADILVGSIIRCEILYSSCQHHVSQLWDEFLQCVLYVEFSYFTLHFLGVFGDDVNRRVCMTHYRGSGEI